MMSIAMLMSPATPMAMTTSAISKRKSRRSFAGSRTTIRFCVREECRKMACGITVAPRIPTASRTLSGPWSCGHHRVEEHLPQGRPVEDHLHEVADGDDADEAR